MTGDTAMTTHILRAHTIELPKRVQAFLHIFANFFSLLDRAFKARKAWDGLHAMSDERLAKIGLSREDIPLFVSRMT